MPRITTIVALACSLAIVTSCTKPQAGDPPPRAGEPPLKLFVCPDGSFQVSMPGDPLEQMPPDDAQATGKMYVVEESNSIYQVGYLERTPPPRESKTQRQAMLDAGREDVVTRVRGKLAASKNITVNGRYAGVEYEIDLPEPGVLYRSRVFLVEQRTYQLVVIGRKAWARSADVDRFFDSLKLTAE